MPPLQDQFHATSYNSKNQFSPKLAKNGPRKKREVNDPMIPLVYFWHCWCFFDYVFLFCKMQKLRGGLFLQSLQCHVRSSTITTPENAEANWQSETPERVSESQSAAADGEARELHVHIFLFTLLLLDRSPHRPTLHCQLLPHTQH